MSNLSIITSYLKETNKMMVIALLHDEEEILKGKIKSIKKNIKPLINDGSVKSKFFTELDMYFLDSQKYPLVFSKIFEELDKIEENYWVIYTEFGAVVDSEENKNKFIVEGCKRIIRYLFSNRIGDIPYDLIFPKNYSKKQMSNKKLHDVLKEKLGISIAGDCEYMKIEDNSQLKLLNLYKYYIVLECKNENEQKISNKRIINIK